MVISESYLNCQDSCLEGAVTKATLGPDPNGTSTCSSGQEQDLYDPRTGPPSFTENQDFRLLKNTPLYVKPTHYRPCRASTRQQVFLGAAALALNRLDAFTRAPCPQLRKEPRRPRHEIEGTRLNNPCARARALVLSLLACRDFAVRSRGGRFGGSRGAGRGAHRGALRLTSTTSFRIERTLWRRY